MKVWNNEDICKTDAFGCSANPAIITWIWSAIWQEASCGIGWLATCPLLVPCRAVCVKEPSNNHDSSRMCPIHSTNSLGLKWYFNIAMIRINGSDSLYLCCVIEVVYSQGKYLVTARLSLPFPLVISSAKYWATLHLIIPPKVSSFKPTFIPLQ